MRRLPTLACLCAAILVGPWLARPLWGQQAGHLGVGVQRLPAVVNFAPGGSGVGRCALGQAGGCAGSAGAAGVARGRLEDADRRRWAPVASLLLPGLGQVVLRKDRFMAYVAMEAWGVLEFANQRTEARRQQNRYRGLARDVARSLYGARPPVGTWAYYESLEHYVESGVFDRLPGGEVDPELDVETHNGAMWLLARQTFWTDPTITPPGTSAQFRNAMNFYLDRAVRSEFRWSWRNAQLEQDVYVRTIRRSNTSFREARQALGLLIANHLLSSVDAFVTLRVEGLAGGSGGGLALRGRVALP